MMRGRVNVLSGGSNVKSVQRGQVDTYNKSSIDVTINAVDINNSIVLINKIPANDYTVTDTLFQAKLTSNTNLNISRESSTASYNYINWQVIELKNIKSLQQGSASITYGGVSSITVPISNVNMEKSVLFYSFKSNGGTSNQVRTQEIGGAINNSAQLGFWCYSASEAGYNIYWYVVEF